MKLFSRLILGLLAFAACVALHPLRASAAVLSLLPEKTSLEVGETFKVPVLLDTRGQEINAVEIELEFPADKLQVVSPNTGSSIIEIWAGQPKFNNSTGIIQMRGGIPNGLIISGGLVTTLEFRVKASGSASLQFKPTTKVLANDGFGTDVLTSAPGIVLTAILPKPQGPIVSSPTHSDQSRWYPNADVLFQWAADDGVEGYSYILNDEALFEPDTILEGQATSISYTALSSGTHFFHIRALRGGLWGGTTHFQVNIDAAPPAGFVIEAIPSNRTSDRQPVLKFFTTDAQSGMDHFEIKVISLNPTSAENAGSDTFFSEAQSPYVLPVLELGDYDVIVRAYDKAHNSKEEKLRLHIVTAAFSLVQDDGLQITPGFLLTWTWVWLLSLCILLFFGFAAWRLKHLPAKLGMHPSKGEVPDVVRKQLEELRAYQRKYGKIAIMVLAVIGLGILRPVFAAPLPAVSGEILTPPTITTISKDLTTADSFYVGGETVTPHTTVVLYWNNLTTGETLSTVTTSDDSREWFYHHNAALKIGNYVLWAQSRIGETISPPSPQFTMVVRSDTLQIGPTHVRYEAVYLTIIGILLAVMFTLGGIIVRRWRVIHIKHKRFMEELRASEESIRRGFAVLRRDLEVEFAGIKDLSANRSLTKEERARERQIEADIEAIQKRIGKEIWDLEEIENEK